MTNRPSPLAAAIAKGEKVQMEAAEAKQAQAAQPQGKTMSDMFNDAAAKAGKCTILQYMPKGEAVIWITNNETDPLKSLLSAAMSIMVKRGISADGMPGVSIRKSAIAVEPGMEYFWQVTDDTGEVIAKGYAASEYAAAEAMKPHFVSGMQK